MHKKLDAPVLTKTEHKLLHNQTIDENSPGMILRDFETLLDFVGVEGVQISGKKQLLSLKSLAPLNSRLTYPIDLALKRPQQKSYPYINGLYLILRTTGLTTIQNVEDTFLLTLDEKTLQSWQSLNLTERYFNLLEAFLLKGHAGIIGERGSFPGLPIQQWLELSQRIPSEGLDCTSSDQRYQLRFFPGFYAVALLDLFGLISVKVSTGKKEKEWPLETIKRTAWGDTLLSLLTVITKDIEFIWECKDYPESDLGKLQHLLQPYFLEWKNNLELPKSEFVDGVYIFKVSLGRVWRKIAIPATNSLEAFSDVILNAFDFSHDHLYYFEYKNRHGAEIRINHPYMNEGPFADDVNIGDINSSIITFLFDFGDSWNFEVRLESIDQLDSTIKEPVVLKSHGKAPEQYPSRDE